MKKTLYQLYYYVPTSHIKTTQAALFHAGAGQLGNYSNCCWYTKGMGQFKPGKGSNAYSGTTGKVSRAHEYKVELICTANKLKKVIAALKKSHPYEEVAYGYFKINA